MRTITNKIGELKTQSGDSLLKMWVVNTEECVRPFVRHSHARFEIMVVNSGYGEYTTESDVFPMEPGDVFVFSSNEIHWITKIASEGLSITNLHFEPRYLDEEFSESYGDSFLSFCLFHSSEFKNRIPAEKAAALRNYHDGIRRELEQKEDQYGLAVHSYLNLILIELLRNHHYRSQKTMKDSLQDMLTVFNYIDSHLEEALTLSEIASVVGMSPNYFSSRFKAINGISLWDYITSKRIDKAIKLILTPNQDMTMLEIALQCGFNNTVNFNKAFKKQKNITPNQLKKNPKLLFH